MILEDIGFYTLSDERAMHVTTKSDLYRCELILTDRCNFKCPYCRGIVKDKRGDMPLEKVKKIIDLWAAGNLHNIRFSGGEPTIYPDLIEAVKYAKSKPSIKRIALSTNGSADIDFYYELILSGVNDFSISLDACCSSTAEIMSGKTCNFDHIKEVIKKVSRFVYTTAGVVLEKQNNEELEDIIKFATSLGVSDIRIIPSAQSNHLLNVNIDTDLPILKYRIDNINKGRHVRGIKETDCHKCHLVKDDMVILNNYHYPCIIHMREQGEPIGTIDDKSIEEIREERWRWYLDHNSFKDPICSKNCLDVCIDHNNKVEEFI